MPIYITRINKFIETTNPTILNLLMDISYSMMPLLISSVASRTLNEVLIDGLKKAAKQETDVLRVALGAFSDGDVLSITKKPGYFSLNELQKNPVTDDRLIIEGVNGRTALYRSILAGIKSGVHAALDVKKQMNCRFVDVKIPYITDGEDTETQMPNAVLPADVKHAISTVPSCIKLEVFPAYFRTTGNVSKKQFVQNALACGIPEKNCHFFADHGDDLNDQQRAFRHMVDILSDRR